MNCTREGYGLRSMVEWGDDLPRRGISFLSIAISREDNNRHVRCSRMYIILECLKHGAVFGS